MIKDSLAAIGAAARDLFRRPRSLALFNALYLLLLAAIYWFVSTKEATVWQLTLTGLLALLVPLLFFVLQAAGVWYTWPEAGARFLARRALRDFWKLVVVSLPVIALAVLTAYLLNKLQARFPVVADETTRAAVAPYPQAAPPPPLRWQTVLFPSLRLLLLGVLLPLAGAHLWVAAAREGFRFTLKRLHRILARAFSPRSVFIYGTGLVGFALMPYVLVYTHTPVSNGWAELFIFGLRLALAFVFTLWGWLITLGALTKVAYGAETVAAAEAPPAPAAVPPGGEPQGAQT